VDDEHDTLSGLFEDQVRVEGNGAVLETHDLFFALTVVVVGDVDHSGKPDWVIWLSDEVLAGTYRDYATLLIKDVAPDGLLRAENVGTDTQRCRASAVFACRSASSGAPGFGQRRSTLADRAPPLALLFEEPAI
jgi:hypothetical protein